MARIETKLPSPEGAGAGQTATFRLPVGRKIHEMNLDYSATGAGADFDITDIVEIRIFANGKPIQTFSGADRDMMNKFDRREAATIDATSGRLTIPFDRRGLKTLAGEVETALNTGVDLEPIQGQIYITSLYMEVQLSSDIVGTVSLSLNATQSDRDMGGAGVIMHLQRHTRTAAGAGEVEISDLPRGNASSAALNRIFFKPSANAISAAKVERNLYNIFERSAALNTFIQKNGVRTPQSGVFCIDKTERGLGGDPIALANVNDFRYKLEMTGAATLVVYSEYLGGMGG